MFPFHRQHLCGFFKLSFCRENIFYSISKVKILFYAKIHKLTFQEYFVRQFAKKTILVCLLTKQIEPMIVFIPASNINMQQVDWIRMRIQLNSSCWRQSFWHEHQNLNSGVERPFITFYIQIKCNTQKNFFRYPTLHSSRLILIRIRTIFC